VIPPTLPVLRRALALALLTAAACAIPARFGDLGPGGRVIGDDHCARDADCVVVSAQADPCSCLCGYQAVNRTWGTAWAKERDEVDRSRCSAACGPCPNQPEHVLCIGERCVAASDREVAQLREQWCPLTPPAPAPAPSQASAAAPDRKALDAACAAPLVQKQALTSVGGYPLEEAPVGAWLPSLPPASLLGQPYARHQLQPVALGQEPMTLTHTEYGDGALAIVSRRLAEGHCVVGTWHLNFGGNGVESWVRQVIVGADKRTALILIETIGHFRAVSGAQPIPAGEQRFWTVLSAASDGLRALSDGDARLDREPPVVLVWPPLAKAEDARLEVGKGRRVWRIDQKSGKFEPSP
jgi:hypothetical protein